MWCPARLRELSWSLFGFIPNKNIIEWIPQSPSHPATRPSRNPITHPRAADPEADVAHQSVLALHVDGEGSSTVALRKCLNQTGNVRMLLSPVFATYIL